MAQNPYYRAAEICAEAFLRNGPGAFYNYFDFCRWEEDNDWLLRDKSDGLHWMAWAITDPSSPLRDDQRLRNATIELFDDVLSRNVHGVWWQGDERRGDGNTNLFIFYPFIEAVLLLQPLLDRARVQQVRLLIDPFMAEMRKLFPAIATGFRRYPNMDAQFALSALLASKVTQRGDYARWAAEYAAHVCGAALGGGALTYIAGTNDCEVYHQIVVVMLARFFELTGDDNVLAALRGTLAYYPNTVEPCGVADEWTDPHWKHYWSGSPLPHAPTIIATLFANQTSAAENRFLANRLSDIYLANLQSKANDPRSNIINFLGFGAYAARFWRAEAGERPQDRVIVDPAIRGPRQRQTDFSWAATAGAFVDTFVGALVCTDGDSLCTFQAAGAQVEMRQAWNPDETGRAARCAYLSARHYPAVSLIRAECALFAATTELWPCSVPWAIDLPEPQARPSGWWTRQIWLGFGDALYGLIELYPSSQPRGALSAGLYLRFGGRAREIIARGNGTFSVGDFGVRILDSSPVDVQIQPAKSCYMFKEFNSSEILLKPAHGATWLRRGVWAAVEVAYKKHDQTELPAELRRTFHDRDAAFGFELSRRQDIHRVTANDATDGADESESLGGETEGLRLVWRRGPGELDR